MPNLCVQFFNIYFAFTTLYVGVAVTHLCQTWHSILEFLKLDFFNLLSGKRDSTTCLFHLK